MCKKSEFMARRHGHEYPPRSRAFVLQTVRFDRVSRRFRSAQMKSTFAYSTARQSNPAIPLLITMRRDANVRHISASFIHEHSPPFRPPAVLQICRPSGANTSYSVRRRREGRRGVLGWGQRSPVFRTGAWVCQNYALPQNGSFLKWTKFSALPYSCMCEGKGLLWCARKNGKVRVNAI